MQYYFCIITNSNLLGNRLKRHKVVTQNRRVNFESFNSFPENVFFTILAQGLKSTGLGPQPSEAWKPPVSRVHIISIFQTHQQLCCLMCPRGEDHHHSAMPRPSHMLLPLISTRVLTGKEVSSAFQMNKPMHGDFKLPSECQRQTLNVGPLSNQRFSLSSRPVGKLT